MDPASVLIFVLLILISVALRRNPAQLVVMNPGPQGSSVNVPRAETISGGSLDPSVAVSIVQGTQASLGPGAKGFTKTIVKGSTSALSPLQTFAPNIQNAILLEDGRIMAVGTFIIEGVGQSRVAIQENGVWTASATLLTIQDQMSNLVQFPGTSDVFLFGEYQAPDDYSVIYNLQTDSFSSMSIFIGGEVVSTAFLQGALYVAGEFSSTEGSGLVSFKLSPSGYTLLNFVADDAVTSVANLNDEYLVISGFSSEYLGQTVTGRLCYFDPSAPLGSSITTLPIELISTESGDIESPRVATIGNDLYMAGRFRLVRVPTPLPEFIQSNFARVSLADINNPQFVPVSDQIVGSVLSLIAFGSSVYFSIEDTCVIGNRLFSRIVEYDGTRFKSVSNFNVGIPVLRSTPTGILARSEPLSSGEYLSSQVFTYVPTNALVVSMDCLLSGIPLQEARLMQEGDSITLTWNGSAWVADSDPKLSLA